MGYLPTRVSVVNQPFLAAYEGGVLPQTPLIVVCSPRTGTHVATLLPSADTTMYGDADGALGKGAEAHLFVGANDGGRVRRAAIAFDLRQIPAGARVTGVTLQLHLSRTNSGEQTVRIYAATDSWGEGQSDAEDEEGGGSPATPSDATWLHRSFPDSLWQAPGGDFAPSASALAVVGGSGAYIWTSEQLSADVQQWLNAPRTNFGWVLVGTEDERRTAKRFDRREQLDPARRPVLTVEYRVP